MSRFAAFSMMPASSAIRMSPTQKDMTPTIVIPSATASFAELNAASVTVGSVPLNAA